MTFSNIIPNWTIFVKEVFWSDALFRNWRNDCIVTKWKLNFPFLSSFNPWVWNHHLDISVAISGYIWSSQAKTSSVIAIWNFFGLTDRQTWASLRGAFAPKNCKISIVNCMIDLIGPSGALMKLLERLPISKYKR